MTRARLRILADANVPFAAEAFGLYGEVRLLPGGEIDRSACLHSDAIIVRSVTPVDASTLDDTPVRFVGTATAGSDHLALPYLESRNIRVASAPGSNAESVVEWVLAALLSLAAGRGGLEGRTIGVIGCGEVGARLVPRVRALGMRVMPCDPPLARAAVARGATHPFVPYEEALADAHVLTYHTPLTFDGDDPTFHLLGDGELRRTRRGVWVINTSRGPVVDGLALEAAIRSDHVAAAAIDVWEGEPEPPAALAARADLATPHIAGYGYDARVAGARMMEEALRDWLAGEGQDLPAPFDWSAAAPAAAIGLRAPPAGRRDAWLDALVRGAYDIRADDRRFRDAMLDPVLVGERRAEAFTELRRRYPVRRSWRFHRVEGDMPEDLRTVVEEGLGMVVEGSDSAVGRDQ